MAEIIGINGGKHDEPARPERLVGAALLDTIATRALEVHPTVTSVLMVAFDDAGAMTIVHGNISVQECALAAVRLAHKANQWLDELQ